MSTATTSSGSFNFADAKAFRKQYIDHRMGILIFASILLLIGLVVYLQVCGAECSGSDPSGAVGSSVNCSNGDDDSDTLNGTATGCMFTLSLICIILGTGMLAYYYSIIKQANKLVDANLPYAAAIINAQKGKDTDVNLLAYQTAMFEQQAIKAGIDPASLVDNPYANTDSSDNSDSSNSSNSGSSNSNSNSN